MKLRFLFFLYYLIFGAYSVTRCLLADQGWEMLYSLSAGFSAMSIAGFLGRKYFVELFGNGLLCSFAILFVTVFNYIDIRMEPENLCFLIFMVLFLGLRNLHMYSEKKYGIDDKDSSLFLKVIISMGYIFNGVFLALVFNIENRFELGFVLSLNFSLMLALHFNVYGKKISESRVLLFCMLALTFVSAELLLLGHNFKMVSSYFLIACSYVMILGRFVTLETSINRRKA